jgi:hypothetical protein
LRIDLRAAAEREAIKSLVRAQVSEDGLHYREALCVVRAVLLPMMRSFVARTSGTTRSWSPSATVALSPPCPGDGGTAPSPLRRPSA